MRRWLLLCVSLLLAIPLQAQTPVNPSRVEFSSPDHQIVTGYDVGVFLLGAAAPVTTIDIGKPAPRADGLIESAINTRPIGIGSYELKVRAKAGTTVSAWTAGGPLGTTPVPFDRVLSPPANLKALP